jgi:peptidyl-prolyl cis-trans isomerase SurA
MKRMLLLLSVGVLTCVAQSQAEVLNRIVATVDDEPITLHELHNFTKGAGGQQNMMVPQEALAKMTEKDILDAIIMNKLVNKEVETQGIKAKDEEIDSYIERIKTQSNLTDEQMKEALAKQGFSMEGYRKQVAEEIERAMLINREIGSRVNVTPQDVERYYKEHGSSGGDSNSDSDGSSSTTSSEESAAVSSDEQVHVRHIFLPLPPAASPDEEKEVLQQIADIRKRTQDGEDFAALATAHSRGPGADQGGDLGFFKKGQMAKEIDDVAFSLQPGEVSQPFRTNAGVHLIKVEERTGPTSKPVAASASEKKNTSAIDPAVAEQIKQKLYNEALRQRYERWFQEDLRFRHQVENFLVADSSSATSFTPKSARPKSSASTTKESEEKPGFFRRLLPF